MYMYIYIHMYVCIDIYISVYIFIYIYRYLQPSEASHIYSVLSFDPFIAGAIVLGYVGVINCRA